MYVCVYISLFLYCIWYVCVCVARLIQFFSQYGVVTEVSIVLDRLTGQSRGFGFVAFSKREPMLALLTPGVVLELDGRRLQVRAAVHRDQLAKTSADEDSAKLFVGGLAATVDDRVLSHHFSQYGRVTYCTSLFCFLVCLFFFFFFFFKKNSLLIR